MICFNWLNALRYLWPRGPSLGLSVCGLYNDRRLLLLLRLPLSPSAPSLPFSSSAPFAALPRSLPPTGKVRALVPSAPDLFDYLEIGQSFIRTDARAKR